MKKHILSVLLLVAFSNICKAQTVKKVMLEVFEGVNFGSCPVGDLVSRQILASNPSTYIPITCHIGDNLQCPEGYAIFNDLGVNGFPLGIIDRFRFPGNTKFVNYSSFWDSLFHIRKAMTPSVSISFSNPQKTSPITYSATVNVKFLTAPSAGVPLKMNVYILEDSISAVGILEQANNSPSIQGGASPLTNWVHNATLRKALGGNWGYSTTIPMNPTIGTNYSENITFTIPANYIAKNINVVAFVAYDGDTTNNQKEILNAEQYALKYWYPTTVNEVEENLYNLNIYPNPASLNDIVKLSFYLKHDATVSMEVVNSLGQIVSKPYNSFEIRGAHTIQWSASENSSLVSGTYFIKISTDKGSQIVQQILIH